MSKKEEFSKEETERRDEMLRRLLKTLPKPRPKREREKPKPKRKAPKA